MNISMPANVPKLVAPNAILIGVAMHEYRLRMHIKKSHRPLNLRARENGPRVHCKTGGWGCVVK